MQYWELYTLPGITDFSHKPPQKVTCKVIVFICNHKISSVRRRKPEQHNGLSDNNMFEGPLFYIFFFFQEFLILLLCTLLTKWIYFSEENLSLVNKSGKYLYQSPKHSEGICKYLERWHHFLCSLLFFLFNFFFFI